MNLHIKNFALATLAAAALTACGGGSSEPENSRSADVSQFPMTVEDGDTWRVTYNIGEAPSSNDKCKNEKNEIISLPENNFFIEVLTGGGIIDESEGRCLELKKENQTKDLIFNIDSIEFQHTHGSNSTPQITKGNIQIKHIDAKDKINLSILSDYTGEYNGQGKLRYINPKNGGPIIFTNLTASITENKPGNPKLILDNLEYNLIEDNGLIKVINEKGDDQGYLFISTKNNKKYFSFDRTISKLDESKNLIPDQTGIFDFEISAEIYEAAQLPKSNDPRFGRGGSAIEPDSAFPLIDAPSNYKQEKINYFLFAITDLKNFATGQFYTAGKLTDPSNKDFTGIDFTKFSVQTSNNWADNTWSEVTRGIEFSNGQVLMACNGAGSEKAKIAITEYAEVVTNLKDLYGKTFTEYSCGVDQENWSEYEKNGNNPFAFTSQFSIDSQGIIKSGEYSVPLADYLHEDGYVESDEGPDSTAYESFATAYKVGAKYYILFKDRDAQRVSNSSQYGLALAVAN